MENQDISTKLTHIPSSDFTKTTINPIYEQDNPNEIKGNALKSNKLFGRPICIQQESSY